MERKKGSVYERLRGSGELVYDEAQLAPFPVV
jgi:hypothetical protein